MVSGGFIKFSSKYIIPYASIFFSHEKVQKKQLLQLCTAHTVFDIGHCTVIHCDAGGVSLVD